MNVAGVHDVEELVGIGDELRVVEFEPVDMSKITQMVPGALDTV